MSVVQRVTSVDELESLHAAGKLVGLVDVPADVYHAGPGISSSGLKALLRSPAHYAAYLASPADNEAMRKGRAVHSFILERETFHKSFRVAPEIDRRTVGGKAAWAEFQESANGSTVISTADMDLCARLYTAIELNALAYQALMAEGGMNELAVFWADKETGILCKAKADRILSGVIFDLKTTQDAQPREFQRSIATYLYHLSAAFYFDGFSTVMDVKGFTWIPIEKASPHGIAFYAASDETLDIGRAEYAQALRAYRAYTLARTVGEPVPGYPQRFETLGLPAWYAAKVVNA